MKSMYGVVAIITILMCDISAYTYQLRVMTMFNSHLKQNQYLIGFSDYHEKSDPANQVQRAYVESFLKRYKHKLFCIVEDLSSPNTYGRTTCCGYSLNTCGLLGGLAHVARSLGIKVDNIEYRYCRVAGVGQLLHSLHEPARNCSCAAAITMDNLYSEIICEIDQIEKYNDGKNFNALYKKSIYEVKRTMDYLCILRNKNQSVADYCGLRQNGAYQQFLEKLCIFDSALIDSKLVHSIIKENRKPYILVFAGGAHINNAFDFLEYNGYCTIYTSYISYSNSALSRSLNINKSYKKNNTRPQAIDLRVIEKFVK